MRWPFARRRVVLNETQRARLDAWTHADPHTGDATGYVVVDVETSGLNLRRDALISIGAVPVENERLALGRSLHRILRQTAPSPRDNILIHGVGHSAQMQGMPPADALLDFLEFIGARPLVAFHAPFDAAFLTRALREYLGLRVLNNVWVDLAQLLPALFPAPRASRRSLDAWLHHFAITAGQRHSAHADALATAQLFLIALHKARTQGGVDAATLCTHARACSRFPVGEGITGV